MYALPKTVIDNLITAVLVLDNDLLVTYANPAAEQLFCQSSRRLRGHSFTKLVKQSSIDLFVVKETIKNGQGLTDSDVTLEINGRQRKVELSASRLIYEHCTSILLEIRTISHQQRISNELSQKEQQHAARELVRRLAHEIKNPLGGLRGAAQLLEKMLPDPSLKEYTRIIIEQADRLRKLVDRLLEPQKPGRLQQENIHVILEKVRLLVTLESQCINVVRDYDPSLPNIEINPEQMEQAMLNVINNAAQILQDTKNAKITLRTRTKHQVIINGQRHRLTARIDISDNGPGIATELQDTLFYPMISGRLGGTGLGLSITRNLIEQHKGKIYVNSQPGNTTFTILLPIQCVGENHE
ncbi:nitrogen regulation protein NR(II) [Candidatus Enterovibrio escicola]|uniref:nitrogen regulation protein NR(II) n=2 Tax=Candidatus Enterovibrio escicola TaxID=1927127 RepID=UPI00168071EE|nr:nitrogen regulation protein NR(II) [Candidatus Enterovibrio escacola]